ALADVLPFPTRRSSDLFPFVVFGEETVFYSELISVRLSTSPEVFLDSILLEKYTSGDLRLPAFFDSVGVKRYLYRGRLTGNYSRSEEHTSELQSRENLV